MTSQLEALYRLDYPLYGPDVADGTLPTSYDPTECVENQPLGLFFQFVGRPLGLLLDLKSDAEQVQWQVDNAASFLAGELQCFGFTSPVLPKSKLSKLIGSELRRICFGFVSDYLSVEKLLFGVKLQFDTKTLVFVNRADEGYYLF